MVLPKNKTLLEREMPRSTSTYFFPPPPPAEPVESSHDENSELSYNTVIRRRPVPTSFSSTTANDTTEAAATTTPSQDESAPASTTNTFDVNRRNITFPLQSTRHPRQDAVRNVSFTTHRLSPVHEHNQHADDDDDDDDGVGAATRQTHALPSPPPAPTTANFPRTLKLSRSVFPGGKRWESFRFRDIFGPRAPRAPRAASGGPERAYALVFRTSSGSNRSSDSSPMTTMRARTQARQGQQQSVLDIFMTRGEAVAVLERYVDVQRMAGLTYRRFTDECYEVPGGVLKVEAGAFVRGGWDF